MGGGGGGVQVEPSMRQRSNFKVQLCHVMLKPSASCEHVTLQLRKVLH